MCSLCESYSEVSHGSFFVLTCRNCDVPMVVLHEHRDWITDAEFNQFLYIARTYFPGYSPRGVGMRSVPGHWHEHMCPPGHGCPT